MASSLMALGGGYSRVVALKATWETPGPSPSPSSTFSNVGAIKPDEFNALDMAVSNAISFNPIWSEIALER